MRRQNSFPGPNVNDPEGQDRQAKPVKTLENVFFGHLRHIGLGPSLEVNSLPGGHTDWKNGEIAHVGVRIRRTNRRTMSIDSMLSSVHKTVNAKQFRDRMIESEMGK